jgi:hypothetical protein
MGRPERARERERKSQLGEGCLQVSYDLSGDDLGRGEIGAVFERLILQPKDVEVEFIAFG